MPAEDYPVVRIANSAGTIVDPSGGGGGGGSGSTPSGTLAVQRATGSTTTAAVASTANATARRTIRNVGTAAIEIGPSGVTYGAGHPLPAGESFTFDDTGRYTGDIYAVAAGGAAWATSTVSY